MTPYTLLTDAVNSSGERNELPVNSISEGVTRGLRSEGQQTSLQQASGESTSYRQQSLLNSIRLYVFERRCSWGGRDGGRFLLTLLHFFCQILCVCPANISKCLQLIIYHRLKGGAFLSILFYNR